MHWTEATAFDDFPASPEEAADCTNAVPVFDFKIAAGDFIKEQWLQDCQYAELPDHFTAKPGFFLAQVVGESMNRRIPNGSWCLFREPSDGSRNGKVVIVQSRDIQDPDTGGQYTVKIYRSEKTVAEDSWPHRSIRLKPESNDLTCPLLLEPDSSTKSSCCPVDGAQCFQEESSIRRIQHHGQKRILSSSSS